MSQYVPPFGSGRYSLFSSQVGKKRALNRTATALEPSYHKKFAPVIQLTTVSPPSRRSRRCRFNKVEQVRGIGPLISSGSSVFSVAVGPESTTGHWPPTPGEPHFGTFARPRPGSVRAQPTPRGRDPRVVSLRPYRSGKKRGVLCRGRSDSSTSRSGYNPPSAPRGVDRPSAANHEEFQTCAGASAGPVACGAPSSS